MSIQQDKTAIIYCRVSSQEQVQGTSLEMQKKVCLEFATQKNLKVLQIFVEEGESAKSANRTEFQKAIKLCASRKPRVDYFIVHKIDRFARNQADHVATQVVLKKVGTILISATEPIDQSVMGRAMEGMLSVWAELDNNVRAERSRSGMIERLKQGVWVWKQPIGYTRLIKAGNLIPDEKNAMYIRIAFEEWSKGTYTFRSLSDYLYARGFRSKGEKKVGHQSIEKILRNSLYCGILKVKDIEAKGTFEPLISEELFFKCQPGAVRKVATTQRQSLNPIFPLKKIIVCAVCGKSLTGSRSRGGNGTRHAYYHHHTQKCELARSLKKDDFEKTFVSYLHELNPRKQYEKIFKAIVMDAWKENYKRLDADNAQIRREIESLESDRQKVFDKHREGVYDDDDFAHQKNYINAKIRQKKILLDEKRIEEFDMEEALTFCFDLVRDSASTWENLEKHPELRLRFQKILFPEKILFDGKKFGTDKISLVYKLEKASDTDLSTLVTLQRIEL